MAEITQRQYEYLAEIRDSGAVEGALQEMFQTPYANNTTGRMGYLTKDGERALKKYEEQISVSGSSDDD